MRRSKRKIDDPREVEGLLDRALVGRLATLSRGGYPMLKPLNFVRVGKALYFHSAREGEKIQDIQRDSRVAFEVDEILAYVASTSQPCQATCLFRSAVALGRAVLVEDEAERLAALAALMRKFEPEREPAPFPPEHLAPTAVVRIDMEELVGKAHWGTPEQEAALRRALAEGTPLPLLFRHGE